MNTDDVLTILVYANELDGRHSPNEVKVMAWREVFQVEAPQMTLSFAKEHVTRHYAQTDEMLSPASLVKGWKDKTRSDRQAVLAGQGALEGHCGRGGCMCSHSGECFKGWIDHDRGADPCPTCRPSLADAVYAMPAPGSRSEHHFANLRNRTGG